MNYVPLPRVVVPIVAVATVVVLAWVGWESVLSPEAFWAPGDLSQYHANVDHCVFCHEPFKAQARSSARPVIIKRTLPLALNRLSATITLR